MTKVGITGRGLARRAIVALLATAMLSGVSAGAHATTTKSKLQAAKEQLRALEDKIAGEKKLVAQQQADALSAKRRDLEALLAQSVRLLDQLSSQRRILDAKFAEQQQLLDQLQGTLDKLSADQSVVTGIVEKFMRQLKAEELARARAA